MKLHHLKDQKVFLPCALNLVSLLSHPSEKEIHSPTLKKEASTHFCESKPSEIKS